MSSQKTILSYAADQDWEVHQIDVKGTYLNATIKERIYMKPLPDYLDPEDGGKVCLLLKGIYGAKQAGNEWYKEMSGNFKNMGYTQSAADECIFYILGNEPIIVSVSTDDMTLAARYLKTIQHLKDELNDRYEISDLGEIHWLLGIEIKRDCDAHKIYLSQRAYIDAILKEFHLDNVDPLSIPAQPRNILGEHQSPNTKQQFKDMENIPYARAIGKLMYLYVGTVPQISFIIWILAQFMSNPGRPHWEAVK
jgi:Reverse transcriptase (RNA-dependent DNA polymerase)